MSNIFKAQIVILCLCLAFVACRKADSILPNQDKPANTNLLQRNGDSTDYQKVTTFLQNKKSSLRTYEANKIDTLLSHLSGQNVMVFEMDDSLDVIICDRTIVHRKVSLVECI